MSLGRDALFARAVQPPSGGSFVALPRFGRSTTVTRGLRDCRTSIWPRQRVRCACSRSFWIRWPERWAESTCGERAGLNPRVDMRD